MEMMKFEKFPANIQQTDTKRFILIYLASQALVEFIQEAEAGGKLLLVEVLPQYVRTL